MAQNIATWLREGENSVVLGLYSFQSTFLSSLLDPHTYIVSQAWQESLLPFHRPETGLFYWPFLLGLSLSRARAGPRLEVLEKSSQQLQP